MTTTQLTKLKDSGFTLDQIITIGEIFDPSPKAPAERPADKDSKITEAERKAYENARKDILEEQCRKEMGPMIRNWGLGDDFKRRCEEFVEANRNTLFCRAMEVPRRAAGTLGIGVQTP